MKTNLHHSNFIPGRPYNSAMSKVYTSTFTNFDELYVSTTVTA